MQQVKQLKEREFFSACYKIVKLLQYQDRCTSFEIFWGINCINLLYFYGMQKKNNRDVLAFPPVAI